MAGVLDRYRQFVIDDQPVVTGFAAVGDAWACTNPTGGRGLSVGVVHAQLLRRLVRDYLAPAVFARTFSAHTEQVATPFPCDQPSADRARIAEMVAARDGATRPAPDPRMARFLTAARPDPDAFRGMLDTVLCLAHTPEVLARPAIQAAIRAHANTGAPPIPGPDRTQLLGLLAA